MTPSRYRPHNVQRQDRSDGSILLSAAAPLSRPVEVTGDWLHRWAAEAPDRLFLAERSGAGWRGVTYAEALQQVRALAAALLARGLTPDSPIMVLSGNSIDHGLLALAAQYVGIPMTPLAEQYALIPAAHDRLRFALGLIQPALLFAEDGARYAAALALPEAAGCQQVTSTAAGAGQSLFADLLRGDSSVDVDAARAQVTADSLAKILLTSGSTSNPKGVLTSQRMLCVNQRQIADALPFLSQRPPVIVDWLPWNHVFGGSHNFNMMLANGGTLYIDDGKPAKALVGRTIQNLGLVSGTLWFNVPVGFAMVAEAMERNPALTGKIFAELDLLFYAGASLPNDLWRRLEALARSVRSDLPLMTSSWGLTETAPAALLQHEPIDRSGVVGVPLPGLSVKLVPDSQSAPDAGRYEVRVKGPSITRGYHRDAARTAQAFDDEGYFLTGDAMRFVDPTDINKGMQFDGRLSEEFKLLSGTWVRAAALRMALLPLLDGIAADLIVTGADRAEVGLLILPTPAQLEACAASDDRGALSDTGLLDQVVQRLAAYNAQATGSAGRIARVLLLSEPASMGEGEITAKGNLNFAKLLSRRAPLLDRLYDDRDSATRVL